MRDDLQLPAEDAKREASRISEKHVAIRTFVSKRSNGPGEGENVLNVVPYGHVKSLHVGKGRAATIFDEEQGVCWLLAYGDTHATGERRDSYNDFVRLSNRGELLPGESDYAALYTLTDAALMDELKEYGRELFDRANNEPNGDYVTSFVLEDGQDASISLSVEVIVDNDGTAEQGWTAFVLPPGCPIGQAQLLDLVADLIPDHVDVESIDFAADVRGRVVAFNELAFTWEHYDVSTK